MKTNPTYLQYLVFFTPRMNSKFFWSLIFASALGAAAFTYSTVGPDVSDAQTPVEQAPTAVAPVTTAPVTTAAAAPTPSSTRVVAPAVPRSELYAGVWNGGQAASWDIPEMDLFSPHPQGYKPEQPIKFSHWLHVEKNGMECQYCHSGINKSFYSTIPSVESCMGCHAQVKTDSPEIIKLKKYYDEKQPIEWEPVNNLPEHAHFNHERHLKAGVGCQSCHGQIQKMEVVEKASSLKMGFCVDCHRHKGASIDCTTCHY